jgi:16S rRNA G966 N2-methylase RsmD
MRIISGKYKEVLSPPKRTTVRPTTDMSKEALFNVLNNHFSFEGLKVLDLFSGNIKAEFASEVVRQ